MAMHPSIQRKAQRELESIVGPKRLPTMDDIPSLPYVDAIFREISRWMPVTPMSLLHRVIEDDEYNGYLIPAGAVIVPVSLMLDLYHLPADVYLEYMVRASSLLL